MEREPRTNDLNFEVINRQAREQLLQSGFHPPLLIAVGSDRVLELEFDELAEALEERKDQMFSTGFNIGVLEEIGELEDVYFVCEAWARRFLVVENEPSVDKKSKVEVLMVLGLHVQSADLRWSLYEMRRNKDGELTSVRPYLTDSQSTIKVNDYLVTTFASGVEAGAKESL